MGQTIAKADHSNHPAYSLNILGGPNVGRLQGDLNRINREVREPKLHKTVAYTKCKCISFDCSILFLHLVNFFCDFQTV